MAASGAIEAVCAHDDGTVACGLLVSIAMLVHQDCHARHCVPLGQIMGITYALLKLSMPILRMMIICLNTPKVT